MVNFYMYLSVCLCKRLPVCMCLCVCMGMYPLAQYTFGSQRTTCGSWVPSLHQIGHRSQLVSSNLVADNFTH